MPRLAHDAVRAGGVGGAQDRADVVRILDPVEHDDQRRLPAPPPRPAPATLEVAARALDARRRAPGATPPRAARSSECASTRSTGTAALAPAPRAVDASIRARADAQPLHAARSQRLEDRVHAANEHLAILSTRIESSRGSVQLREAADGPTKIVLRFAVFMLGMTVPRQLFDASAPPRANSRARSRHPTIVATPAGRGSSAPRSIAGHGEIQLGTAGLAGERHANRMEQRRPFWPVRCLTRAAAARNASRSSGRRAAISSAAPAIDLPRPGSCSTSRHLVARERGRRIELEQEPQRDPGSPRADPPIPPPSAAATRESSASSVRRDDTRAR